ncbi:MAG: Jag N-terminal domain-containing protein [Anaerolineales bacterium]|jgi:spoIIIJ-associated protein|nr:Jag N-terminal domain-containing protein [Anaerolineales bacterium]MCK4977706.1 Jag N-terminal domain-containing protein [Anaerolineales bacterium]
MSESRPTLEIIAPSVEEAIAKGLSDLGMTEEEVDVEILDEGSRGLFGLGSRQARIRLSIKSSPSHPEMGATEIPSSVPTKAAISSTDQPTESRVETIKQPPEDSEEDVLSITRETVEELLQKMKVKAQVSARYGEADDRRGRIPIYLDINGKDLSILIGRQAETLNALQYITSLIVGKELGRSVTLIVDVEGYRLRREQQVRQLARRMAEQAVKTGRRQVLEPMPANERRFVHIELRENPEVTTESIGEGSRRKVTIIPQ